MPTAFHILNSVTLGLLCGVVLPRLVMRGNWRFVHIILLAYSTALFAALLERFSPAGSLLRALALGFTLLILMHVFERAQTSQSRWLRWMKWKP